MIERSSDILDVAANLAETERAARIEEHLARTASMALKPKGVCHYCEEKTTEIFCDAWCAEDYEYTEKRKKANGV